MEDLQTLMLSIQKDLKDLKNEIASINKHKDPFFIENWLMKDKVIKLLNISQRSFTRLIVNNKLPFSKINGRIYVKIEDLESLLEKNYKA